MFLLAFFVYLAGSSALAVTVGRWIAYCDTNRV
jgi:hypothetical protein